MPKQTSNALVRLPALLAFMLALVVSLPASGDAGRQTIEGLCAASNTSSKLSQDGLDSTIINRTTGLLIRLENIDGHTLVTNLQTGEQLVEDCRLAGVLTDEIYTRVINYKTSRDRALDGSAVYSFNTKFTSPNYWVGSDSGGTIRLNLTAKTYNPAAAGDTVRVRLYRSINWWPDKVEADYNFTVLKTTSSISSTSTGKRTESYYYIVLTKSGSYWVPGSLRLRAP